MPQYKVNRWTRFSSYFKEIKFESTSSIYNPILEVVFFKGRFMLNTPTATYSFEDLYTSFGVAFTKIDMPYSRLNSVLVLGLGLGSIPHLLQSKHGVNCTIDCIEIDPVIIALANKYYPTELWHKLNIIHDDAYNWIMSNTKKYDLINVDIFFDKNIPKKFHEAAFLKTVKNTVAENGILVMSRLTANASHEYELIYNTKMIFPEAVEMEVNGNTLFCWKNSTNF